MFKQVAQSAGLPEIHPHRGRHTFISGLVKGKVDAYLGMALTRQKSVNAYKVYSEAVRYEAARAAFFEARGIQERQPLSLQEMVNRKQLPPTRGDLPSRHQTSQPTGSGAVVLGRQG
ncbi:MAG: hypothetical protein KME35_03440 [Aphanocapsa sp. GSE-SYN-MK-11-07L]|jgi:hypothetical protein|nr:hypothetical protein [Aphanocapsa sp. GSE-SYN-MK-11-07L]